MISMRIVKGRPTWYVVVEFVKVQSDQTGLIQLASGERPIFPEVSNEDS